MQQDDQRNLILALVIMVVFLFAYDRFIMQPAAKQQQAEFEAKQQVVDTEADADSEATQPGRGSEQGEERAPQISARERSVQADTGTRIAFDAPSVDGSIRLRGARLDTLSLKDHFVTTAKQREVQLLSPESEDFGYFAFVAWTDGGSQSIAGSNTDWELESSGTLTADNPVRLSYRNGDILIERVISVDENYMFTYADTVTNEGNAAQSIQPLSVVRRYGGYKAFMEAVDPGSTRNLGIVHTGLVGVLDGDLELQKYKKIQDGKQESGDAGESGWWALTDKYWMAALIPDASRPFSAETRYQSPVNDPSGRGRIEIRTAGQVMTLSPGDSVTVENRIFAGAKELDVLNAYEKELGIERFDDAVDWGFLYFLTKPFFWLLSLFEGWFSGLAVSFGIAILLLTVVIKAVFFPIQNKAYASMTKMKKLTEPMKEIRERFAADKQRQQQEILKLYQREKVNPLAGCLPILIQIPVFFALYKTLVVTIEMRHAPFFGWINDLSAPDPTAIGNLFGLLGGVFSAAAAKDVFLIGMIIGVGAWPILYGLTMWGVQSLSPPPPDPTQRRIFALLPIIFTFVFAGFAAGLVIYWTWSNVLSLIQQYVIMRRQGVDTQFDKFLARRFGKKSGADTG